MTKKNSLNTAGMIADLAEEKMAEDVVVLDMNEVSGLCDYFVIAEATSATRAKAIAEHVELKMKHAGDTIVRREGMTEGSWIILDFGDVVFHVFQAEIRKYYNIEQLWGDAPRHIRKKA